MYGIDVVKLHMVFYFHHCWY